MKYLIYFLLISLNSFAQPQNITLAIHQEYSVPLNGDLAISASDKKHLKLSVQNNALLVVGKKVGTSTVKVGSRQYIFQVVTAEDKRDIPNLHKLVQSSLGLKLEIRNGQSFVTGNLYSTADLQKLLLFRKKKSVNFYMQTLMPTYLQTELQGALNKTFVSHTLQPQKIIFEPYPRIYLSKKTPHLERIQDLAATLGIESVVNQESLEVHPTVKVEVYIVEIKKNYSFKFGLQWPEALSAQLIPNSAPVYGGEEFKFSANAFEGNGYGKVIAQPTLLARSGEEARFHAGGEFPIQIQKFRTQEVFWKTYGLTLMIKPEVDRSGRLKIKLETEITSIDASTKVGEIPGIKTNKVSSQFDLLKPQTIAISGLVSAEEFNSNSGLPGLQKIPILGKLFSSRDFLTNKTELVIFVRPQILQETL